jgi:hypothetical protein
MLAAFVMLAGGIALAVTHPALPTGSGSTTASQMSPQFRAELDALQTAMATGNPTTVDSLTTELSQTVANPDGTLTRTDYAEPVRVFQNGAWQPVNAGLRQSSDGSWQPTAVPSGVSLSNGGSGPLAVLTSVAGQQMSLSFPAQLPAPVISGDTATYQSVWPGTDLQVTVNTLGGIDWTVIVRNATAAANPSLRHLNLGLTTGNLAVGSDSSGNLGATGADGATQFSGPPPSMWDSAPSPALTGPAANAGPLNSTAEGPGRGAHAALVHNTMTGNSLSLTPSTSLLSATTQYPVYLSSGIAPDSTVGSGSAGGATAVASGGTVLSAGPAVGSMSLAAADSVPTPNPSLTCGGTIQNQNEACSGSNNGFVEVQQGCPTATNYNVTQNPGTYAGNGIGYNWWDSCLGVFRSYYQFDTSGLLSDANGAPSGGQLWVQSATLYAWVKYGADWTCSHNWPVNLDWTGSINSGTNWSNKPGNNANDQRQSVTTPPGPNANSSCTGQTLNFSVAYAMSYIIDPAHPASNITFGLSGNETASSSSSNIGFMRIGNNPDIVTVFDVNPPAPTSQQITPASAYEPGGPANYGCNQPLNNLPWSNSVNYLKANIQASINGEPVKAAYSMWDESTGQTVLSPGGNASLWSSWYTYSGTPITTGTQFSASLQDGDQYTWTTQAYVSGMSTDNPSPHAYWSKLGIRPVLNYAGASLPDAAAVCGFNYDATAPAVQSINSTQFPQAGSGQTGSKAGNAGTFTFQATDPAPAHCNACLVSGVYEFLYSLNRQAFPAFTASPPSSSNCSGTSGTVRASSSGTASCSITVGNWGTNILYVEAVDQAGNVSDAFPYYFYTPWNPNKQVVPGDVNGDSVPDMLAVNAGNLTLIKGNTDPSTQLSTSTASVPADSPDGTSWSGFQVAHRDPFSQVTASANIDDLIVHKTSSSSLYLYENNPSSPGASPQFEDTSAITPIQRPACSGGYNCTSHYDPTWEHVTQLLAPGDAWNPTPGVANSAPADNGQPSLLTVEKDPNNPSDTGSLWIFQGTYGPGLQDPIELGSSGWANVTIIAPGYVNGQLTIWAYDDTTGNVYSYPIYSVNKGPSLSQTLNTAVTATSGTVILTYKYKGTTPAVASPGALGGDSYPGLYFATPSTSWFSLHNLQLGYSMSDGVAADGTSKDNPGGVTDPSGRATCLNGCLWYFPGQAVTSGGSPLSIVPVYVGTLNKPISQLS